VENELRNKRISGRVLPWSPVFGSRSLGVLFQLAPLAVYSRRPLRSSSFLVFAAGRFAIASMARSFLHIHEMDNEV
jgi:hypothetical protein